MTNVKPLDTAKICRATAAFLLGCAVLAVVTAAALALHFTLEVALLLYIAVIVLVSMAGEVVPSVVLALVAAASLTYFFTVPIFSFSVDSPEDVTAIVVFVATGVLVASVVKRARRLGEAAVLQEARLREAQARAELAHANRVTTTGQLAASISHEVAQPVSASITNANTALRWLAAEPPNLDEAREALNRILRDGKRATDIIVRIRAFVRREAPRTDRFDLNEMVSEIVALSGSELHRNGISPRTRLADGLPPVTGDRVQLQQVVLNLILNAVDAMREAREESPELLITTGRDEAGGVRVAVRDTGPGLAPDNLPRLFDAFYTTKPAGMGMGLSICRSIVEAHGGRITATGNEPRGAVFEFTLPGEREKTSARQPA